jgi:hypothetical protein
MLPAFGAVRDDFNLASDSTAAAQIIAVFLGQIAQLGRLAILRIGLAVIYGGGGSIPTGAAYSSLG